MTEFQILMTQQMLAAMTASGGMKVKSKYHGLSADDHTPLMTSPCTCIPTPIGGGDGHYSSIIGFVDAPIGMTGLAHMTSEGQVKKTCESRGLAIDDMIGTRHVQCDMAGLPDDLGKLTNSLGITRRMEIPVKPEDEHGTEGDHDHPAPHEQTAAKMVRLAAAQALGMMPRFVGIAT